MPQSITMFSITCLIIAYLIYYSAYVCHTQIVGGEDAPEGKYPYQVSLKRYESHFCGGAIVSKRYVITAAHCLDGFNDSTINTINVDVGSVYLSSFEATYKADVLIVHPNYTKIPHLNDIGLIKLKKDITFNKNVKSIALISHDEDFEGVKFRATGWGKNRTGMIQNRLQQIVVTGFSQRNCSTTYGYVTERQLCTLQGMNKGMCDGDSGSALTLKGELVGIVSYGHNSCASGFPDVFTRVYHYKSWVNNYINAGSNQQLNILFGFLVTIGAPSPDDASCNVCETSAKCPTRTWHPSGNLLG